MIELKDKTMGIISFGRIVQNTARIAMALGMRILAYDAYRNHSLENEFCRYVELDELLAKSDMISLHAPLTPETQGIINSNNIMKMRDGVVIINNSRGVLIVEQDLRLALDSGKVAAALDVVSSEPIKKDNLLFGAKNCIIYNSNFALAS